MRTGLWCVGVLFVTACVGDYEGDTYPEVADWIDIRTVDVAPAGTRAIGVASAGGSRSTTETGRATCANIDARFIRRMKRAASQAGGEFLVDVSCITTAHRDMSWGNDDPDTHATEYCLRCRTSCDAEVARRFSHDVED